VTATLPPQVDLIIAGPGPAMTEDYSCFNSRVRLQFMAVGLEFLAGCIERPTTARISCDRIHKASSPRRHIQAWQPPSEARR